MSGDGLLITLVAIDLEGFIESADRASESSGLVGRCSNGRALARKVRLLR